MTEITMPPVRTVMHELKFRRIEVSKIERLTGRYLRVTFTGDDFADFVSLDPEDHMKLLFSHDPDGDPVLPARGDQGWDYPADKPQPALRDYTPRRFDPATRQMDVEFVIHGQGPASAWAEQAKVGQKLAVVGPRGSHIVDYRFDWYLLIGDETTWPSIARRLEEFPNGANVHAYVEVDGEGDEMPFTTGADATVTWIHRAPAAAGTSDVLEQAIRSAAFPAGSVYVWAGGEATTLKGIRRYLKNDIGIPTSHLRFSGHWKRGTANHDHHEEIGE